MRAKRTLPGVVPIADGRRGTARGPGASQGIDRNIGILAVHASVAVTQNGDP
jgi:hypothetical protein